MRIPEMPKDITATVEYLKTDNVSPVDAVRLLEDEAALVRVNAVDAVGRLAMEDESLLDDLVAAARNPRNQTILMGRVRISHVAIANLLRVGTQRAKTLVAQLLEERDPEDRDDLLWYLQSEGLCHGVMGQRDHTTDATEHRTPRGGGRN
jgi:hypothetical protein